jgi:methionine synthase II (cobalamin-independent)
VIGEAHLVGGLAFETGEQAIRAVGEHAAAVVDWVPDGETGVRRKWMSQHRARFDAQEALEPKPVKMGVGLSPETRGSRHGGAGTMLYGLKPGRSAEEVQFETFGYVEPTVASYQVFAELKQQGLFRPTTRFQLALPSAFGMYSGPIHPDDRDALAPAIERGLFNDIEAIANKIPHDELAIQWDVAHEFGVLTGANPTRLQDPLSTIVESLVHTSAAIPRDIALGLHLCYGDAFNVHFLEPADTAIMADIIRGVLSAKARPIDRVHLPVPIDRDDASYFRDLRGLDFGSTRLYLGLIHHEDGLEGARRRIAAAKQSVPGFGVATECGMGRTLADPVALLKLHVAVAELAAQPADTSIEVPDHPRSRLAVDPAVVNARLRAIAEQIACPECAAGVGEPCGGEETARPHMERYHEAMLGVLAGRLRAVNDT